MPHKQPFFNEVTERCFKRIRTSTLLANYIARCYPSMMLNVIKKLELRVLLAKWVKRFKGVPRAFAFVDMHPLMDEQARWRRDWLSRSFASTKTQLLFQKIVLMDWTSSKEKLTHLKSSSISNIAPKKCTHDVIFGAIFFQNIKKSMPVYKTSLFLIPMNQYVNVLQQKWHFTDLFLMA